MPPDAPPRPSSLLALPSYLASQTAKNAHRELARALAEHGLNLSHYAVLCALADHGPLAQQQIAGSLDIDKSHITVFVEQLRERGLVTRRRAADDRRRYRVALSAAGQELVAELAPAVQGSQRCFHEALSGDELATLMALLARVVAADRDDAPPAESADCI